MTLCARSRLRYKVEKHASQDAWRCNRCHHITITKEGMDNHLKIHFNYKLVKKEHRWS